MEGNAFTVRVIKILNELVAHIFQHIKTEGEKYYLEMKRRWFWELASLKDRVNTPIDLAQRNLSLHNPKLAAENVGCRS
ncbi:hypothetical protein VTL71DRAFT_10699 [Oculimacula yallundae]|uniref:Uncharacterized protein n=1 Tax=Oculimacula yallundae TaxID=86028 RepID=A0ABR4CU52_9HELO